MCAVSAMGDHYSKILPEMYPWTVPMTPLPATLPHPKAVSMPFTIETNPVSREEFNALKRDVEEMIRILKVAKKYDEDNGEPHCETDEKMAKLRMIAEIVGIDLDSMIN